MKLKGAFVEIFRDVILVFGYAFGSQWLTYELYRGWQFVNIAIYREREKHVDIEGKMYIRHACERASEDVRRLSLDPAEGTKKKKKASVKAPKKPPTVMQAGIRVVWNVRMTFGICKAVCIVTRSACQTKPKVKARPKA